MAERVIYHELAAVHHHHHHPHPHQHQHQHHQQQSPHTQPLFQHPQPQQRRPKPGMAAMPAVASPGHAYANANGAATWRGARQQQYYANTISTAPGPGPGPAGASAMKQLQAKQLANSDQQQSVAGEVTAVPAEALPTTPRSGQIKPPRNKSEEAIADLLVRIPDVGQLFDVHSRIGNGTFSTVLLATMRREANLPESLRRKFAIKHHIPTSHPDRIMKELQCMTKMGGTENVVGIHCCLRCDASAAFVMPYMPHDRFHDFYQRMDVPEIRLYMRNLLVALRHVHKFDVIHRDVKPSNFLYNRRRREFLLVDFGLAQHVNPPAMGATAAAGAIAAAGNNNNNNNNNNNSKRPRERETEAVQASVQADAGLGGAVKRMRLHEEGTKMPLKPVNEIAQGEMQPADGSNSGQQPATMQQQQQQQQAPQQQQQDQVSASTPASGSKYNTNRSASGVSANSSKCFCFANPSVCLNCLMKKEVHASRAGTPGYRPPEVLLKYPDQTTAVDVWAAGVIFLSIMSSVYPFFKAPNDFIALAEIVTIFGDQAIRKTALALDRMITLSQRSRPLNLRKLCLRFRHRAVFSDAKLLKSHESADGRCEVCRNCDQYFFNCLCEDSEYMTEPLDAYECFPASAYDLLHRLLEVNPHKRITAAEALQHPFFTEAAEPMDTAEQPPANGTVRKVRRQRHHKPTVALEQLKQQADLELHQTAINKLLN